ncbi:hypothetical protein D3C76_403810 [compost metagenome]
MTDQKPQENIPTAQPSFDYSNLSHMIPMMGLRPIESVYNWMNTLIYGAYGDGKTYLVGSSALVPQMRDILYISLEGGEKTLRDLAKICKANNVDPSCIMVMPIQTYKQFAQSYETLKMHVAFRDSNNLDGLRMIECQLRGVEMLEKIGWQPTTTDPAKVISEMSSAIAALSKDTERLKELIPTPKKFRTVIIDSLTEAQKYCMYQILGIDPLKQKLDAEPDSAEWKDWGSSREMIQFLVRRFRDLDIHAHFVAAVDEEQDAKKRIYFEPMLPGKLSKDVRGLVDVVGFIKKIPLEGGKVVRRLFLEGGDYPGINIAAKHRFGSAMQGKQFLDDPTMQTLYDLDNN